MKCIYCFLVAGFLIASCSPAQSVIAQTQTSSSTKTIIPSKTRPPTRTPAPTLTPRPSLTASLTSTVLPPLTLNKWYPESVLVKLEHGGGDGCCLYSYPPSLVLYANGRIIVNQDFEQDGEWRNQPMTKVYSREETCSILNTIDQTGFLYYNTNSYHPQNSDYFSIDGAGYVAITVNAWRSNYGDFFGLFSYLYLYGDLSRASELWEDPGSPIIPPSLRDIYFFLGNFSPESVEVFIPQRLGLIVTNSDRAVLSPESPVVDWPFDEIDLSVIEKLTTEDNYPSQFYIVEGEKAVSIYEYFGNSFGSYGENVKQSSQEYVVFLRPLLPYEIPELHRYNIIPDPNINPPGFELECYPSDGILPIPTSLIP